MRVTYKVLVNAIVAGRVTASQSVFMVLFALRTTAEQRRAVSSLILLVHVQGLLADGDWHCCLARAGPLREAVSVASFRGRSRIIARTIYPFCDELGEKGIIS